MDIRGRVHEAEGGRCSDGLVAATGDELAGGDAERRRGGFRGAEGEVVHGLEDGERFSDGNGLPEIGLDVVVNGGPIRALLIHGDPDGSTQWTAVIGSLERGDEVLSVDNSWFEISAGSGTTRSNRIRLEGSRTNFDT